MCVSSSKEEEITFYFKGGNCFKSFRAAALTVVPKSPTVDWLQTKWPPLKSDPKEPFHFKDVIQSGTDSTHRGEEGGFVILSS